MPTTLSGQDIKNIKEELELKYDNNFTNAFAFKKLARYLHYEMLDIYE